jgi:hypothetical protein
MVTAFHQFQPPTKWGNGAKHQCQGMARALGSRRAAEKGSRRSLGAGTVDRATVTSGVKVAQHPQGLTLTLARGGGSSTIYNLRREPYNLTLPILYSACTSLAESARL